MEENCIVDIILGKQDKPVVLYNNPSGTTGTITLSETSANFEYLEIFGNVGGYVSTKVSNPNGKKAILLSIVKADTVYHSSVELNISGTSITQSNNRTWYDSTTNNNTNKIVKVLGYR